MNFTSDQKYKLLLEIAQKTRDTLDLDEIMVHLLDTIQTIVHYDAGGIFVLNQDIIEDTQIPPANVIAGVHWRGYAPPDGYKDDMFRQGKGLIGTVIHSGKSLVVPDVRLDERYIQGRRETLSEIAVPIRISDRAVGALNLESDKLNAYDQNDLEVLRFFADAAGIALEKAMLHRQILEKELLDKQLQMARDVQMHLLPLEDPAIPGYDIAGVCIPTEKIGGDYYDYMRLSPKMMGIAVADLSGHGIAPALAMTAFRSLLRSHAKGEIDPAAMAEQLNHLLPEFTGGSHFITLCYGELQTETDEITFVSCGHPSPRLIHLDGRREALLANGPALGIFGEANYFNESKFLSYGDILILYTDGVVEIENHKGDPFGVERLMILVSQYRQLPAKALLQKVIAETKNFSGSQTYLDDFTLVIVKKE
jgi:sigma-B regulation protein RsbU (phosphoserine phosphatase)